MRTPPDRKCLSEQLCREVNRDAEEGGADRFIGIEVLPETSLVLSVPVPLDGAVDLDRLVVHYGTHKKDTANL